MMLYALTEAPGDAAEVGQESLLLAALAAQGLPVAPTWVLGASAFDRALTASGVADQAAEIAWNLRGVWNDLDTARRVLDGVEPQRRRVARALRRAALADELGRELEHLALMETLWTLRPLPLSEEKGVFGNLFPPLLSMAGGAALWDGICQVWATAFSRRALLWAAGLEMDPPRLAILLTAMPPITARDCSATATAASSVPGLGGPLVRALYGAWQDGLGTLYSIACGRAVALPAHSRRPAHALVSREGGGGLERVPYPPGDPLSGEEARRLGEMAQLLATHVERVAFFCPAEGEPLIVEAT